MKNMMTKIGLSVAVLLLAAVATQPAQAACAFPGILATTQSASSASQLMTQEFFDSANPSPYGYPGAFYSYAMPPLDMPSLQGVWWAVGTGNPAVGAGDDNGSWDPQRWIQVYSGAGSGGTFWYGAYFATAWGTGEVDGCINNNATGCTCILLTTNGPNGPKFLLMGQHANANFDSFFVNAGNAPFIFADMPTPEIQSSLRDPSTFDLTMGVGLSNSTAGVYQAGGCNCNLNFRVREIVQARGLQPPTDRNSDTWSGATNDVVAADAPASVFSACGSSDTDVYLATELIGDPTSAGGFAQPYVSGNSLRVECGPNLAEPTPNKERPVPVQRPTPRGGRTGR